MHDVRVALEGHERRHADGAVVADAADVVAPKIDQHHVLGPLLFVALELFGKLLVLGLRLAARTRAGNRMRHRLASFDAHQHFRRRADDGTGAHPDEEHVRRRIHVAERAVDRERIDADLGLEPLRQHDLVDVAGRDVFLAFAYNRLVRVLREVRRQMRFRHLGRMLQRQRSLQFAVRETRSSRTQTDRATVDPRRLRSAHWQSTESGAARGRTREPCRTP